MLNQTGEVKSKSPGMKDLEQLTDLTGIRILIETTPSRTGNGTENQERIAKAKKELHLLQF